MARSKRTTKNNLNSNLFLIGGVILLAAAALGVFALMNSGSSSGNGSNGPRLTVDQDRIDLGKQPMNKMVRAEFQIKNAGEQVLQLDASTPVKALEGC